MEDLMYLPVYTLDKFLCAPSTHIYSWGGNGDCTLL